MRCMCRAGLCSAQAGTTAFGEARSLSSPQGAGKTTCVNNSYETNYNNNDSDDVGHGDGMAGGIIGKS